MWMARATPGGHVASTSLMRRDVARGERVGVLAARANLGPHPRRRSCTGARCRRAGGTCSRARRGRRSPPGRWRPDRRSTARCPGTPRGRRSAARGRSASRRARGASPSARRSSPCASGTGTRRSRSRAPAGAGPARTATAERPARPARHGSRGRHPGARSPRPRRSVPADQPRRRNSPSVTEGRPSASWSRTTSRTHSSWTARKRVDRHRSGSDLARAREEALGPEKAPDVLGSERRRAGHGSARRGVGACTAPRAARASGSCRRGFSAARRRTSYVRGTL